MCTLTIAWQVFAETPILLGANRDELFDRPSHPPRVIESERQFLAPIDEEAGGTWIGYNEDGVVAAISNRWIDADLQGERSRGLLVRDALEQRDATDACRAVERALDAREYDAFNLLVAGENGAILIEYDGGPTIHTLSPGVHVVMNVGYDTSYTIPSSRSEVSRQQAENGRRLYEHLQPQPGESAKEWHERDATALSDHAFGVCVHGDEFGTRSSSLIRIDSEERRSSGNRPTAGDSRMQSGDREARSASSSRAQPDDITEQSSVSSQKPSASGDSEERRSSGSRTQSDDREALRASSNRSQAGDSDGIGRYEFADGPPCRTDYELIDEHLAVGGG